MFYVDVLLNPEFGSSLRGNALDRDEAGSIPHGYAAVSSIKGTKLTFAHELGHLIGLADNPVSMINALKRHHHRNAYHLLMKAVGEDFADSPITNALRFTKEDEKWIFEPSDRARSEAAKSYVERHD